MNKELTPLEALENLKNLSHDVQYASKIPSIDNELKIIETALKRIPDLEKALDSEIDYGAMMNMQGLELKKKLEHSQEQRELYFKQSKELKTNLNKACKQLNEYGRKLKALEIIKELAIFENNTIIIRIPDHEITENGVKFNEENMKKFDLLKEVLL